MRPRSAAAWERGPERRAGLERLLLDGLEAGVRTGACSDPSRSRGIDSTASPAEVAVVDQRRNVGWVGERLAASEQRDGHEREPRPGPGRLLLVDELRHYARHGSGCRFRPDRITRLAAAIAQKQKPDRPSAT